MELEAWWRDLAYRARSHVRWAPASWPHRLRPVARDLREASAAARARAETLGREHAAIATWSRWLTPIEVQEALYVLDTLIEIDGHRRYWNLVTRRSRGERIARAHAGSQYVAGSVRDLRADAQRFDIITWTLPGPLAAWGLPQRFFEPASLLAHVLSLLAPRGALIIINQSEHERDEQRDLLAAAGVTADRIAAFGPLDSPLSTFRHQRWAFRITAT